MNIVKWNTPYSPIMRDFDRLFSGNWHEQHGERCQCLPRTDILESDRDYELVMELAGMDKNDVNIKVEDQVLIVSGGQEKDEDEQDNRRYRRMERGCNTFERRFRLPREVEVDKIEAEFDKGLLTIRVPKSEKVAGREISIK